MDTSVLHFIIQVNGSKTDMSYNFVLLTIIKIFSQIFSRFHLVSTSKMGPDSDPNAVVDPRLNIRGVKRLRQIDAGISMTFEIK